MKDLYYQIRNGGRIVLDDIAYKVGNLELPDYPRSAHIVGGPNTRFEAIAPNMPIFKMKDSGAASRCVVENVTFVAHPDNKTANAVELDGCRHTHWIRNRFEGPWVAGYYLKSERCCYGNVLDNPFIQEQNGGPLYLVSSCHTGTYIQNANANTILNPFVYANHGMIAVIDVGNTTLTTIRNGVIESNPGAIGVIPGNCTTVSNVWFESLAADIQPQTGRTITPNNVVLDNNYYSAGGLLHVPSFVSNWDVRGLAGGYKVVNQGYNTSIKEGVSTYPSGNLI